MSYTTSSEKETAREFIAECIHLYRDLPSLWKVKSKEYYDREQKKKDYEIMLAKYQKLYPNATVEDVKKKFNALRTNYRRELRRQRANPHKGRPRLWYYEEMMFLEDSVRVRDNSDSEGSVEFSHHDSSKYNEDEESIEYADFTIEEEQDNDPIVEEKPSFLVARKVEIPLLNETQRSNEAKRMKIDCEDIGEMKDEHYYWAMSLAANLRNMEYSQQLFAKKAITEIMVDGQLGLLRRDSVKINQTSE